VRTLWVNEGSLCFSFGYLEPVKRAKDWTDVTGTGHASFNNGMCQRVMDL